MTFSDINNVDFNNIGTAPLTVKVIVVAFLIAFIIELGFYLDIKNQLANFDVAKAKEVELRSIFEVQVKQTANLDEHKTQLEEMNRTFGTLLRQLPSKTEIPALIVDISQTALASGLEAKLFKPGSETEKEFYAEKPIKLVLDGDYHQFGLFASEVSALPRIVTLHDIKLSPNKDGEKMTMNASAKTYRYLDGNEK